MSERVSYGILDELKKKKKKLTSVTLESYFDEAVKFDKFKVIILNVKF